IKIPVSPNTDYNFFIHNREKDYRWRIVGEQTGKDLTTIYNQNQPESFNTRNNNSVIINIRKSDSSDAPEDIYTQDLQMSLILGTELKPFTPYNPSNLSAPVTLSAAGDRR